MLTLSLFSCKQEPVTLTDFETDQERLEVIWNDIQLEIADKSCDQNGACKSLAFGKKACGGPAGFLIYSSSNVNEAKLKDLVEQYTALQAAMNEEYNLNSDCALETPPDISCVNGQCE